MKKPKPTGYNDARMAPISTGDVLTFDVKNEHPLDGYWLVIEQGGLIAIEQEGVLHPLGVFDFGQELTSVPATIEGNAYTDNGLFLMMADYSHELLKSQGVTQRRSKWPFSSLPIGDSLKIHASDTDKNLKDLRAYVHVLASKSGKKFATSINNGFLHVERVK